MLPLVLRRSRWKTMPLTAVMQAYLGSRWEGKMLKAGEPKEPYKGGWIIFCWVACLLPFPLANCDMP